MTNPDSILKIVIKFLFPCCRLFAFTFYYSVVNAQECPPNIDFENGTFEGWTCHVGFIVEQERSRSVIRLFPIPLASSNRHTMYSLSSGNGLDPYAKFPINCPNGSGHSVKLGNDEGGALAEGLSYEFTVPANRNLFKIIYNYAVVFQESPHLEYQQPRFEVEVTNVTRNERISCSSFEFHPFGPLIPGFKKAANLVNDVPLWYKDWTTSSINLNGHAGETIRLFFRTADCTYFDHFGYAYIDVNTECNGEFADIKYCPDDTLINLTAPSGYQSYTWYDNAFTQVLSMASNVSLLPEEASAPIPVQVFPYYGHGCVDTLYAKLTPTLTVNANAGRDVLCCNNDSVNIGSASIPGLAYSWSPAEGLSDPFASNPLANPGSPSTYVLTANSSGGGCVNRDTVFVNTSLINDSLQVIGSLNYCIDIGESPVLKVENTDSIQWFRNDVEINGANQTEYKPIQTGNYYAALFNKDACKVTTLKKAVEIDQQQEGISYPIKYIVAAVPTNLEARNFGDSVLWRPSLNLQNPNINSPVFTGSSDQVYTINIKTISGCITVDTQMIKIIPHADIYVPTAFTPNEDGHNDVLRPIPVGIKEFHYFKIFNRLGKLIFETKNPASGWDGKVNAVLQSSQVVVWIAEGMGWDNKIYVRKGASTILR